MASTILRRSECLEKYLDKKKLPAGSFKKKDLFLFRFYPHLVDFVFVVS
jgi:hypothetical protein